MMENEEQEPVEGQEPEGGQGQEPTKPQEGTLQGQEPSEGSDAAAEARREAAATRRKLRDAEAKIAEFEKAQLSDQERTAAERDELRQKLEASEKALADTRKAQAITAAATRAKAVDPDVVLALLAGRVEVDDDGNPTGVDELIAALAESKPYLFTDSTPVVPGAPSGSTQRDRSTESGKRIYRTSELNDRKFYESHRDDILAALAEGRVQED